MKTQLLAIASASLAFLAFAERMEFALTMDGTVRIGKTDAKLRPILRGEGWKFTAKSVSPKFKFPDAATGTAKFELQRSDGREKTSCGNGFLSLTSEADGCALVTATVRSACDQKIEDVVLAATLAEKDFAGGRWKASSGKEGTFPVQWDGKANSLVSGKLDWLEISSATGETFRISFDEPTPVAIQDSRKWKCGFALRISSKGGKLFPKDAKRQFRCHLSSPAGARVSIDRPVKIETGADWIPLDYRKDIEEGSALDFSKQGLQDAPAGKYGWLANAKGHFEFEKLPGRPQRFYGVNLCFTANFPDRDLADRLVTRLVRLGYNSVRIHHYENELVKGSKDRLAFNPEALDRLDYLLAKCYGAGLYVTTDLYVSRSVLWRTVGIDRDGDAAKQVYKNLICMTDVAYADWCAFAKALMNHVNPHTGRAYRDEPGLPLISLINEGHLDWCWKGIRGEESLKKVWKEWIVARRAEDAAKYAAVSDDAMKINPWGADKAAFQEFRAFLERRFVVRAKEFLRGLGVKAMLTNQNAGGGEVPMMSVRQDLYDYVDTHFYVDHPHFVANRWSLPSRCDNRNPALAETLAPESCAKVRVEGLPFTVTEWNFSGPGMYRGVGGIMTGAISARDDYDGLWRFAYAHRVHELSDREGVPGYFNVATDPLGQASDRASILLFLRGDLAARDEKSMQVDKVRGSLALVTARTAGGFVPSGSLAAGPISFDVGETPATVWASSLDENPIARSKRLLVTHLTDVQADGNVYADATKKILLKWGKYPPIVRAGSAKIALALDRPEAYSVWALDTTGHRIGKIPARIETGKLAFTADVKGSNGACMLYEIAGNDNWRD